MTKWNIKISSSGSELVAKNHEATRNTMAVAAVAAAANNPPGKKASAIDDGPVTTTKALLVQIFAPRKFSARNSPAEGTATTTSAASKKHPPAIQEEVEETTVPSRAISFAESEDTSPATATAASGDSAAGVATDDPTEDSQEVTPEEAAAVAPAPSDDKDEQLVAIIDVEELLRICFSRLAVEWHLLSIPTYTMVQQLKMNDDNDDDESTSVHYTIEEDNHDSEETNDDDDNDNDWMQVSVMVRPASLELILDRLDRIGVGTNCGTLTVIQTELCRTASPAAHNVPETNQKEEKPAKPLSKKEKKLLQQQQASAATTPEGSVVQDDAVVQEERAIEAARAEWKNAATRLRIEQVREQIVEQASFSFDFIALLVVASILAGIGLMTDNTVVIVASMLVSPIMGPVLGLTFGTRIQDWKLVATSFLHECLALIICVVIGAFVGLCASFTNMARDDWPTQEMLSRGEGYGLLTGVAIAIPSGMGVCLSILGGNTSSLVGVAISASLLPPAVNTGVCLIYAFLVATGAVDGQDGNQSGREFAEIGGISFALTVINILCIWLSGLVMFEIKEVAPAENKNAFWAKDLKIARTETSKKPIDLSNRLNGDQQ